MAFTITFSVDEETKEIQERIKKEKGWGLISKICQDAIKDYYSGNTTLEVAERKIEKLESEKKIIEKELETLNIMKRKLSQERDETIMIQQKDEIENEIPETEEISEEKKQKEFLMYKEVINILYKIPSEELSKTIEEFILYKNNCISQGMKCRMEEWALLKGFKNKEKRVK